MTPKYVALYLGDCKLWFPSYTEAISYMKPDKTNNHQLYKYEGGWVWDMDWI